MLYTARAVLKIGEEKLRPPMLVIDGVGDSTPGLSGAAFTPGELALVVIALPLGIGGTATYTHLFGIASINASPPASRTIGSSSRIGTLDAQDIDVRVDGTVTHRGTPFATVRGKRAPTRAE